MEQNAANIILGIAGEADTFTLRYGWFTFHLGIKLLSGKQLMAISVELSKLGTIDQDQEMFPALMEGSKDLTHIANAIAIATNTRWRKIVARGILKLSLKDIQTLFAVIHKQSDPTPFFFISVLAKGKMNILKKPEQ